MRCVLRRLSFLQEVEVTRNCCQGISGIQSWFLCWSLAPPGRVPKASHFSAVQFDRRWWRKESISALVCSGERSTSCQLRPLAGKSSGTGEETGSCEPGGCGGCPPFFRSGCSPLATASPAWQFLHLEERVVIPALEECRRGCR